MVRIALDFDGVITHTVPAMVRYASAHFGLALTEAECVSLSARVQLDEAGYRRLIRETHETEYALTFEPTEGVADTLAELSDSHELLILTSRSGASLVRAEEWLVAHRLRDHFVDVVHGAAGTKAAAAERLGLDLLLDDRPYNLMGFEREARAVLWTTSYNADDVIPDRCTRVRSWAEFVGLVSQI